MIRTAASIFLMTMIVIISSCKTSNDVADSGWLQKRKYRSGMHLNIGKNKSSNKPSNSNNRKEQQPESIIADANYDKESEKWWQPADTIETFWLSGSLSKTEKKRQRGLKDDDAKLEQIEPSRKLGRGKLDTKLSRKLRQKSRPIEPSNNPHRDGLVSLILLVGFFLVFWSIPIINLAGSIIGLVFGIKAKRGGEEALGMIGLIGNAIALGLSILYALVLLFYILYFMVIFGLIFI